MIVVNSPNNPTGAVIPRGNGKTSAVAARHKLLLLSDECYCHFLYDTSPFS